MHLTRTLLAKPMALLDAHELKQWRDGLLTKLKLSTVNRMCRHLAAALELARQHDHRRIKNQAAWEIGLAGLPDAQQARNVISLDPEVRAFVSAAYGLDHQFGLLTDVLATGARPSQSVRLRVGDLQDHPVRPKLMMPNSGKGGVRNRAQKESGHTSVPITVQLAAKLKEAAKGRADDAPLLTRSDGAWDHNPGPQYRREVPAVVKTIGLDPAVVTMYALRHSSIASPTKR